MLGSILGLILGFNIGPKNGWRHLCTAPNVFLCWDSCFENRPCESDEYHAVADDDEDEGNKEDLAVEDDMVDVEPLIRCEANQQHFCWISHWRGEICKEVHSGALVEILGGVLEDPPDDGLGGGEHQGEDPGHHHHHSGSHPLLSKVQRWKRITDCDVPSRKNYET